MLSELSQSPLNAWIAKEEGVKELGRIIGSEGVRRALRDSHARRRPRPCGITVHPGQGCRLGCIYCYVPEMGFKGVRKYPLSGDELAYALLSNPWVVPGRTLAAIGSVTEPFLPELTDRTLEYLKSIREWLNLPCQVSTKLLPPKEVIVKALRYDSSISILVSASTISRWRVLEPGATPPEDRIAGWGREAADLVRIDLFLRPLIPGLITGDEIRRLISLARRSGFKGVVAGSLRITKGILERLKSVGIKVNEIASEVRINELRGSRQVPVSAGKLKSMVKEIAEELGMDYSPSSCSANIKSHGMKCLLCSWGPCGGKPVIKGLEEGVKELIKYLRGRLIKSVIKGGEALIVAEGLRGVKPSIISNFLSEYYRLRIKVLIKH